MKRTALLHALNASGCPASPPQDWVGGLCAQKPLLKGVMEKTGAGEVLRASGRLGTDSHRIQIVSGNKQKMPKRLFLNIGFAKARFGLT